MARTLDAEPEPVKIEFETGRDYDTAPVPLVIAPPYCRGAPTLFALPRRIYEPDYT